MDSAGNGIVRWGILGTARIATRLVEAISATDRAEVAAVASRSAERAADWAAQHSVPTSYGSYQELVSDESLDAIYIPLPPSMHAEWTIRVAEAGKHVLCEKPIAMNAREAEEMAAACREAGVQLMDATMWVHHPRSIAMRRQIDNGSLGEMRRVTSAFGFVIEPYLQQKPPHPARREGGADMQEIITHEYRFQRDLGGGALFDTGWYCVRVALWAFGAQPSRVFAMARYRHDVDINLSGMLWYDDDRIASFDCGYDLAVRKWFELTGTKASIVCDDFLSPWDIDRPRYWVHDAGTSDEHVAEAAVQEQRMVENFCHIVRSGELDRHWPDISIANQRVCDALAESARAGRVVEIAQE